MSDFSHGSRQFGDHGHVGQRGGHFASGVDCQGKGDGRIGTTPQQPVEGSDQQEAEQLTRGQVGFQRGAA